MRMTRSSLGLVLLLTTFASTATAETDEQRAMVLFERGRKLARDGHCADAIPTLLESVHKIEGVGPLLNLGNCYESLGKTASAHKYFLRAQEIATARDDRRQVEAAQRARSLEKDLPFLTIHVPASLRTPSTELRVDGELWPPARWDTPQPIDPGSHDIEFIAPPEPKQSDTITVRSKSDHVAWTAKLARAEPPPPPAPPSAVPIALPRAPDARPEHSSTQRTAGLVAGSFGVAGLVVGTIAGLVSLSAHHAVTSSCASYPHCDSADRSAIESNNSRAQSAGTISTIGFVAGGILLAGGAALFFTGPKN